MNPGVESSGGGVTRNEQELGFTSAKAAALRHHTSATLVVVVTAVGVGGLGLGLGLGGEGRSE